MEYKMQYLNAPPKMVHRSTQGLIALENIPGDGAIDLKWACTSPANNVWQNGTQKFKGVGGHLFAIAGNIFLIAGYNGVVYA